MMDNFSPIYNDILNRKDSFFLLAGPCVVENRSITFEIAESIVETCRELSIPYFFKASYRKANRSSLQSFTGIGDDEALQILADVKDHFHVPIVTDIHTEEEAVKAAQVADIIQIPAFLSRQTSLLIAAAQTGKIVNIKKGQFLSPESMRFAVEKVRACGNDHVNAHRTRHYFRLSRPYCGFPRRKSHATKSLPCCFRLYPLVTAT